MVKDQEIEIEVGLPALDALTPQADLVRKRNEALCGSADSTVVPQNDIPIFLTTKLLSISQICKEIGLGRNLGRYSRYREDLAA